MDLTYLGKILKLVEESDQLVKNPPSHWNQEVVRTPEEIAALAQISNALNTVKQFVYEAKILKGSSGAQIMQWVNQNQENFPERIKITGATESYLCLTADMRNLETYPNLNAEDQLIIKTRVEQGFKTDTWTSSEIQSLFKCKQFYCHGHWKNPYLVMQIKYSKKILSTELMNEYFPLLFIEILGYINRSQMR